MMAGCGDTFPGKYYRHSSRFMITSFIDHVIITSSSLVENAHFNEF